MADRGHTRRPVILVPARFSEHASALRYRADVTARKLMQALYDAGGEPLALHPTLPDGGGDPDDTEALDQFVRDRIWMADGIVLPGGGDLAARWSGQQAHPTQYDVDEIQDAFDLALARVAATDGIPLLSICRGVQVVNVARGGDLVQDIPEEIGTDHRHFVHQIGIVRDSPLHDVAGSTAMTISCYHHQGIRTLGQGLQSAASAQDGTIEAVTSRDQASWYLGVQWHPEDTADSDPQQANIFAQLIGAASRRMPQPMRR